MYMPIGAFFAAAPLAVGGTGRQVYPLIGLYIRIYMYEQDGVGWAEIREVL